MGSAGKKQVSHGRTVLVFPCFTFRVPVIHCHGLCHLDSTETECSSEVSLQKQPLKLSTTSEQWWTWLGFIAARAAARINSLAKGLPLLIGTGGLSWSVRSTPLEHPTLQIKHGTAKLRRVVEETGLPPVESQVPR